ncbi:MAG: hypothetical protein JWL83_63 [Actinomycetia bacterium]|nr:hypothetical protein [Actinomycetes bacterium]
MCMTREIYYALAKESREMQEAVLGQGFCHNDSRRRCRGAEYVTYTTAQREDAKRAAMTETTVPIKVADEVASMAAHMRHRRAMWKPTCPHCGPMPRVFFVVWRLLGGPPTVLYFNRPSAEYAKRQLAKANPHTTFCVLKSKSSTVFEKRDDGMAERTRYYGKWRPDYRRPRRQQSQAEGIPVKIEFAGGMIEHTPRSDIVASIMARSESLIGESQYSFGLVNTHRAIF